MFATEPPAGVRKAIAEWLYDREEYGGGLSWRDFANDADRLLEVLRPYVRVVAWIDYQPPEPEPEPEPEPDDPVRRDAAIAAARQRMETAQQKDG